MAGHEEADCHVSMCPVIPIVGCWQGGVSVVISFEFVAEVVGDVDEA